MEEKRRGIVLYLGYILLFIGIGLCLGGAIMLGIGIKNNNHSKKNCQNPATTTTTTTPPKSSTPPTFDREKISLQIQNNLNPENIRTNLRDFTQLPHQAGTDANLAVAHSIMSKWVAAGLEDVHLVSYDVLLSYPDWENPNIFSISDKNNNIVYKTTGVTPPQIQSEQGAKNAGLQWLAYSPPGKVSAPIVYCGSGTDRDFAYMQEQKINIKGNIALVRYGGSFRGDMVKLAAAAGAIGVLLYSDPNEVAPNGTDTSDVYINTVYMPGDEVQRGTIHNGDGDPNTPLYPSKPNLWRSTTFKEAQDDHVIPTIPALPISYNSALEIFKRLGGPEAPSRFQGGLKVKYNLGPGFTDGSTPTFTVKSSYVVKTIQNVIGYVYGSEEPDKYVILGNHYDAWVYGSADPNAGTATLAEVVRATVQTMNETRWRPARTIMFANWDAEEYGLIGSAEFVEEFTELLSRRAIVYINMDCLKGNETLYVQANPSITTTVYDAARNVANPRQEEVAAGRPTVYDTWTNLYPDNYNKSIPYLQIPSGGSDQKTFVNYLGVPAVNFYYIDTDKHFTYPLYHTLYETPFLNEHLMDTDNFKIHTTLGKYWAELAVRFADKPTIPFSLNGLTTQIINQYIPDLAGSIQSLNMTIYTDDGYQQLKNMATTSNVLYTYTSKFDSETISFEQSALLRSQRNDKLILFERCFVNPRGTTDDPSARHVLYSINKDDAYAGSVMQQVYAVINKMMETTDADQLTTLGRQLANEISIVHYSIQCALKTLGKSP